ncbi:class I SAM-dependent methyltransferase [Patescibacteria group bacterium]|nr:class I SAM-dependent methyltransferase [Patescibacteria group bacterium]
MTKNNFDKNYYYGKVYKNYDNFMDHKRYAKDLVDKYNFKSFLDIGCGCGNLVKEIKMILENRDKKECKVYGIDISKFAVKKANVPYVQVADCVNIDFPDDSFDFVHILGTFSYLEKKYIPEAIKEVSRISSHCILFDDVYSVITKEHSDFDQYRKVILSQDEWLRLWSQKELPFKRIKINGDEIIIKKCVKY